MKRDDIEATMKKLGRDGRLVAVAAYCLTQLKRANLLGGGMYECNERGMQLGAAIEKSDEFTGDEIAAAALLVVHQRAIIYLPQ